MTSSRRPNSTPSKLPVIGILGGGQLSMMMTEAYQQLGGQVFVFAEHDEVPASSNADHLFIGNSSNRQDLLDFFNKVDLVTLENEFIDSQLLADTSKRSATPVLPNPDRYSLIENKLSENLFFQNLGIPIADFFEITSEDDLIEAPGFLKLAKGGYDGIGTYKADNKKEAVSIFNKIESSGSVLFEHMVDFKKELSIIAVANSDEIVFYPMVETYQEQNTCRYVAYPAGIDEAIELQAKKYIEKIMQALDTRGVFAFEFFLTKEDKLVLNESAPRPHNSGHITLDLMDCSQFENHMRAVADIELKHPKLIRDSALMVNLLGTRNGNFDEQKIISSIEDKDLTLKLYDKKQSRIRRKMGHINLWGKDQWQRAEKLVKTLEI